MKRSGRRSPNLAEGETDAVEMARNAGVDPMRFRRALRAADLDWHQHGSRWVVLVGSAEQTEMAKVLESLRD